MLQAFFLATPFAPSTIFSKQFQFCDKKLVQEEVGNEEIFVYLYEHIEKEGIKKKEKDHKLIQWIVTSIEEGKYSVLDHQKFPNDQAIRLAGCRENQE